MGKVRPQAHLFRHWEEVREVLALTPLGLFTDVDGTLCTIAPSPQGARIPPEVREVLKGLSECLALVALFSGRPSLEVKEMVALDGVLYVGNHGLELWQKGELRVREEALHYRPKIQEALEALEARLRLPGVVLENKGVTASIHYRLASHPARARRQVLEYLKGLPQAQGVRITHGKKVVELRPPLKIDKGTALEELATQHSLRGCFYLGDDRTDIDAFRALHRWRRLSGGKGLAIAVVGEEPVPGLQEAADFILHGVPEVMRFLSRLREDCRAR